MEKAKKKAKVYYERLVGKDHVKVARPSGKKERRGDK